MLFHQLSGQELDLLIIADWERSEAAADGILITAAQVDHAYQVDIREQFGTPARFRRYLRRTGETIADVRFRVRVTLVHAALLKAEHLTEGALGGELKRRFKPQTACARFYVVSDCAGAAQPRSAAGWAHGHGEPSAPTLTALSTPAVAATTRRIPTHRRTVTTASGTSRAVSDPRAARGPSWRGPPGRRG